MFQGPESLGYEEALDLMREMQRLKQLEDDLLDLPSFDFDDRLMSATNTFATRHNLGVKPCERTTALAGKEKVLKHGANWMGGSP